MDAGGTEERIERFTALCRDVEPRLRRALVAAYGPELGSEAAADALSWAWEHADRVAKMDNPAGYLWRVGQTSVRGATNRRRRLHPVPDLSGPVAPEAGAFEPGLRAAMDALPLRQRTAVLLVHGYGYSLSEAAEVLGCRIRTLRHHLDRGLAKLRAGLGANDGT